MVLSGLFQTTAVMPGGEGKVLVAQEGLVAVGRFLVVSKLAVGIGSFGQQAGFGRTLLPGQFVIIRCVGVLSLGHQLIAEFFVLFPAEVLSEAGKGGEGKQTEE